jgi:hypothetical protein
MTWLRAGVPLSLIADLAPRGGPLSREILTVEALADDCAAVAIDISDTADTDAPAGPRHGFSQVFGS